MSLFLPLILLSCIPLFVMFLLQLVCHTLSLLLNACRLYAAMFVRGFPPYIAVFDGLVIATGHSGLWPTAHGAPFTSKIYLRPFALFVITLLYSAARYLREICEYHRRENILTECHCNIARFREILYAVKVLTDRLWRGNNQIQPTAIVSQLINPLTPNDL
jgi:hypothetical protein